MFQKRREGRIRKSNSSNRFGVLLLQFNFEREDCKSHLTTVEQKGPHQLIFAAFTCLTTYIQVQSNKILCISSIIITYSHVLCFYINFITILLYTVLYKNSFTNECFSHGWRDISRPKAAFKLATFSINLYSVQFLKTLIYACNVVQKFSEARTLTMSNNDL